MSRRRSIVIIVLLAVLGGILWWRVGIDSGALPEAEIVGIQMDPPPQVEERGGESAVLPVQAAADLPAVSLEASAAEQQRLDRLLFPRLDDSEWAIEGRVSDEKGVPLPGTRISAMPLDRPVEEMTHGESDARGVYRVGVAQDGLYRVTAEMVLKSSESHDDIPAGSTNVDFVLGRTGVIEGQVLDGRTGEPVKSFHIGFLRGRIPNPGGGFQYRGQGDEEGRFRLENVQAGEATIYVRATGYVFSHTPVPEVPSGDTIRDVVVLLTPAHRVSGKVVDASGAPVADAEVIISEEMEILASDDPRTRTDTEGTFSVEGIAPGPHIIFANHEDYAGNEAATEVPSESEVVITLLPGGAVEGRVTVFGGASPGASVTVSTEESRQYRSTKADEAGYYRLDGITPGGITVHGSIGKYPAHRSRSVESQVGAGETAVADIDFPSADASIEGNIYGANMEPAEMSITLKIDAAGNTEQFWKSRVQGAYAFIEVPPGPATLEVRREQNLLKRIAVELVAGDALVQDIYLDTGFDITCTFSVSGEFDEIRVMAIPGEIAVSEMSQENLKELQSASLANATSAAGESVVLGGLEAGTYTIFAWAEPEGYHVATRDTRPQLIASAATAVAVVTLGEGNEREEVELALE